MPGPANTMGEAAGQAPPNAYLPDGVANVRVPNAPTDNFGAPPPYPFRAEPWARAAVTPIAYTEAPFDKLETDYFTGQHGNVRRVNGTPTGEQEAFDAPNRAIFRPVPFAWDSPYTLAGGQVGGRGRG